MSGEVLQAAFISDIVRQRGGTGSDRRDIAAIGQLTAKEFRGVLQDLSLDQATFYGKYGVTQQGLIEAVVRRSDVPRTDLALLELYTRSIEISSRFSAGGDPPRPDELRTLREIVRRSPGIPEMLTEIYKIDANQPNADYLSRAGIDWSTLELHRLGTTSLVFVVDGISQKLILKLSHVLFTSVGPIASATSSYYQDWRFLSRDCPYVVRVRASGVGWVLEDFIEGPTLQEFIAKRILDEGPDFDGLSVVADVLPPLIEALDSFHRNNKDNGHGDLNPTNIIVQPGQWVASDTDQGIRRPKYKICFIDMGRNLLASTTIGRVHSVASKFVAPEVKELPPDQRAVSRTADYYSLGHLIPACLDYNAADGFYALDERLYRDQPALARLASWLVDSEPDRRLRNLEAVQNRSERKDLSGFEALKVYVESLTGILQRIASEPAASVQSGWRIVGQSVLGTWSTIGSALRLFAAVRRSRHSLSGTDLLTAARTLVGAVGYSFGLLVITYSVLVEIHRDPLDLEQAIVAIGFDPSAASVNWQVRIVGATFLVAGFQYNLKVFGGITFIRTCASRAVRIGSELVLWLFIWAVPGLILVALLTDPHWWIICSASGLVLVALSNHLGGLARKQIARQVLQDPGMAAWFLDSSIVRLSKYDILNYWTPTLISYTSVVAAVGTLSRLGFVHDWIVWAVTVSAINIVVFSYSQATRQGPILRSNFSQYVIAGENIATAGAPQRGAAHASVLPTIRL